MKTIEQIANAINVASDDYEVGGLQGLRKELRDFARRPSSKIVSKQTISRDRTFHHGGRSERQFNIGFDGAIRLELRHGIEFSFEAGQTLRDIAPLRENPDLFNEYLRLNRKEFAD